MENDEGFMAAFNHATEFASENASGHAKAVSDALPNILLVDDDRLSRRLVSSLLVACGYQGAGVSCYAEGSSGRLAGLHV